MYSIEIVFHDALLEDKQVILLEVTQPKKVEMNTLVSRLSVACHQRSGKYRTYQIDMMDA